MFLMPSRFEPSGLNQLYSMRYGTPPVVRRVGGLADSVTDTTAETLANNTATGFVFDDYDGDELWQCLSRAMDLYRTDKAAWTRVMRNGMARDSSWTRSAQEYEALYESLRQAAR